MKVIKTLPFALFLCVSGEYAYAEESAEVQIEATVEMEFSITVSTGTLAFSGEEVDRAVEKRIYIETTANTPTGVLVVTGCEGAGNHITLRKDSRADGPALPFTIRRGAGNGDFQNNEWKINTSFGKDGSETDGTNIYLKPAKQEGAEAGDYACALTIRAQAK